jgi:nascent polypeptide-associated complex subunit alpha
VGGQGSYFFIDNPDVYSIMGGKRITYIIFGEARQGGNRQHQQAAMAQAKAQAAMAQRQQAAGMMPSMAGEGVEIEEVPDLAEEDVDESGVDDKDIGLVMSQASCSRAKAVKALKENGNDLVNAIMSLTT